MDDKSLLTLAELRKSLKGLMQPEILTKLADFLDATGGDVSMIERYDWFCHNSHDGVDCKYARMAKDKFEKNEAKQVAEIINWLYRHWSCKYE